MRRFGNILVSIFIPMFMMVILVIFICNCDYFKTEYNDYIAEYAAEQGNTEAILPTEYYGYQYLLEQENSEALLRAYNKIAEGVQNCEPEISLFNIWNMVTSQDIQLVNYCYVMDYPQVFWLDNSYQLMMLGDHVWSIKYTYLFSPGQLPVLKEEFNSTVESILKETIGLTDIDKEIYIHDYLCKNVHYSTDASVRMAHSAYGALIDQDAVCEGQAKAFLHLMREAGFPCMFVYGYSSNSYHAWNIVKIDGVYYNVDITGDNSVTSLTGTPAYNFFNLTTDEISKTHIFIQTAYDYPVCDTEWKS